MDRAQRLSTRAGVVLLAALVSGCTMVGTRGPGEAPGPSTDETTETARVERFFGGGVTFDDTRLPLTLELFTRGAKADAVLRIPDLEVVARGTGTLGAERVELRLEYDAACPGVLEVEARLVGDAARIEGRLRATDCTGSEEGALLLVRRSGRSLPGLPRNH